MKDDDSDGMESHDNPRFEINVCPYYNPKSIHSSTENLQITNKLQGVGGGGAAAEKKTKKGGR